MLYHSKCFYVYIAQAHPECALGQLLRTLCGNSHFIDKLVNSYIMSTIEEFDLNCSAARVLLNATTGLKTAHVFKVYISSYYELTKKWEINDLFV